jgi:oligopeptide/dipeptide ABC transporter ATP-binding protein
MAPLLELRNVSKIFGGGMFNRSNVTVAVDDISFTISEDNPEITTIAGESGSGKSTMARLLLGVTSPTYGTVFYKGKALATMTRKERKEFRREVQPIFQDPFESYNPFYKVDHVLHAPAKNFQIADSQAARTTMIEDALMMVGLQPDETLGRYPHQLSGGQRQRVMVARALLLKPRIILADEPVSMVDASLRATILESIQKLNKELGISVVYITHDLTTAYQISNNIMIMYKGSVVEAGAMQQVIQDPQHPYTQLLVDSIPQPDPKIAWGSETFVGLANEGGGALDGCKFADRCPNVMDICNGQVPSLYQTRPHTVVNCFLYKDSEVMENPDIASAFVEQDKIPDVV